MIETPSNPLNTLVDIALARRIAEEIAARQGERPIIVCDNTLLGPLFQHPLRHGADISVYSLTKYVGGHSDLDRRRGARLEGVDAAGPAAALGHRHAARPAFLLDARALARDAGAAHERRQPQRRDRRAVSARAPEGDAKVHHLAFLPEGSPARRVYAAQCEAPGSTFSFDVKGGEAEAFRVLNALQVFKLAVSLGGTESLTCHPASTTHSGVPKETRDRLGVTDATIRVSIGIEHPDDLVADLAQALATLE